MKKQKISVVITTLNEEKYIGQLLASLKAQTLKPSEVIIVDAGSTDDTKKTIQQFDPPSLEKRATEGQSNQTIMFFIKKSANQSVGRNFGISKANHLSSPSPMPVAFRKKSGWKKLPNPLETKRPTRSPATTYQLPTVYSKYV